MLKRLLVVVAVAALAVFRGGLPGLVGGARAGGSTCTTTSPDTDGDHIPDCWEVANGLNPLRADAGSDKDHDGLSARKEYQVDVATTADGSIFSPYAANDDDSNDNGVEDGDEDLDGDGIKNEDEAKAHSAILNADTNNNGVIDGQEDSDGDGLTNAEEADAVDQDGDSQGEVSDLQDDNGDGINDANEDFDCDGVPNKAELKVFNANSDRHGGTDALDDSDGDGVDNQTEFAVGDDPFNEDSNDDGISDGNGDADGNGIQDGDQDGTIDDSQGDSDASNCTNAIDDQQ